MSIVYIYTWNRVSCHVNLDMYIRRIVLEKCCNHTQFICIINIEIVVLHETIHELKRKKLDGVLFKIDFEKAYDKVNWSFLQ